MTATLTLTPPIHAIRSTRLGPIALLRAMRGNALAMWDRRAYEQPAVVGNLLGRVQVLLNDPEALHHVLVSNAANYRRPALSHRLLRPILGEGLLLAEGTAWRHHRADLLAPCHAGVDPAHCPFGAGFARPPGHCRGN